ncbi:glycosyltransferase family 2 protein [Mesorhizobium sp. M1405]|uniref:glycosyltransferase family 2 protein n=1 Tax=Mesorhizobium sp. M1405 TaxID=2957098 RepID=UPI00333B14FE
MKLVKISVLTVCRNAAATIRHTLDSFFAQHHEDKELIVIDGASTDETLSIISSYPQERMVVVSEPDRGMYDALNKALRLYTGDAMGVLNSDDAYHDPSVLGRIANALAIFDIVHGHLDFVKDHGSKVIVRRWNATPPPATGFRSGWMPAHPTFYVRRAVVEQVGPYDLSYATASDYDWMLRAIELFDFTSAVVDHRMVDMMHGGASTRGLASYISHNIESLRSRRRWLGSGILDVATFAKPGRKIGQFITSSVKKTTLL